MSKEMIISSTTVKIGDKKFFRFATKLKDTWYTVKFTRAVNRVPSESGRFILRVNTSNISIQENNRTYITNGGEVRKESDILWISGYESLQKVSDEELEEENRKKVESLFE